MHQFLHMGCLHRTDENSKRGTDEPDEEQQGKGKTNAMNRLTDSSDLILSARLFLDALDALSGPISRDIAIPSLR